jgi:hypothetical protein
MAELIQSLDFQLRSAIAGKRLVALGYLGKRRVVEPHDYGIQGGVEKVFVNQLRDASAASFDRRASGWRLFEIAKIESCVVLSETFRGSRGRADQKHQAWDALYARVKP